MLRLSGLLPRVFPRQSDLYQIIDHSKPAKAVAPKRKAKKLHTPLTTVAVVLCCGIAATIASCAALGLGKSDDVASGGKDYEAPVVDLPKSGKMTKPVKTAKAKTKSVDGAGDDLVNETGDLNAAATNLQAMFDQMGQNAPTAEPGEANLAALNQGNAHAEARIDRAAPLPGSQPMLTTTATVRDNAVGQTPGVSVSPVTNVTQPTVTLAVAPAVATPAKPELTDAEKKTEAAKELAKQIKPEVSSLTAPLAAAMPLIGLETIQPGAAANDLDGLAAAAPNGQGQSITAMRELVKAAANDPTAADPKVLAKMMRSQADKLSGTVDPFDSLAMGTVALCQRVDGFGRYNTLPTSTFQAGRQASMILYSEIQNFAQRPSASLASAEPADLAALPDTQWSVEIGQELQLVLDADGSTQWRAPEGVVRDVSRSQRNDYYLVQRIDLPKNLSVGKYTLKVIVRDKAAGAEVETNIPIQIVADPASARK